MVTIASQSKVFRICPEWLMWSMSGVNGHLEGRRSQSKSWRGRGVAHEAHQNAPKWTKKHQNGNHCITEQSVSNLSWVTNVIHFWSKWTLGRVEESEQVMEGSWGRTWGAPKCTKMDQKAPKWSPLHHRAKYYEFVLSDSYDPFLDQMDTLKRIRVRTSQGGVMGSRMRCTKMQQNAPKWSP